MKLRQPRDVIRKDKKTTNELWKIEEELIDIKFRPLKQLLDDARYKEIKEKEKEFIDADEEVIDMRRPELQNFYKHLGVLPNEVRDPDNRKKVIANIAAYLYNDVEKDKVIAKYVLALDVKPDEFLKNGDGFLKTSDTVSGGYAGNNKNLEEFARNKINEYKLSGLSDELLPDFMHIIAKSRPDLVTRQTQVEKPPKVNPDQGSIPSESTPMGSYIDALYQVLTDSECMSQFMRYIKHVGPDPINAQGFRDAIQNSNLKSEFNALVLRPRRALEWHLREMGVLHPIMYERYKSTPSWRFHRLQGDAYSNAYETNAIFLLFLINKINESSGTHALTLHDLGDMSAGDLVNKEITKLDPVRSSDRKLNIYLVATKDMAEFRPVVPDYNKIDNKLSRLNPEEKDGDEYEKFLRIPNDYLVEFMKLTEKHNLTVAINKNIVKADNVQTVFMTMAGRQRAAEQLHEAAASIHADFQHLMRTNGALYGQYIKIFMHPDFMTDYGNATIPEISNNNFVSCYVAFYTRCMQQNYIPLDAVTLYMISKLLVVPETGRLFKTFPFYFCIRHLNEARMVYETKKHFTIYAYTPDNIENPDNFKFECYPWLAVAAWCDTFKEHFFIKTEYSGTAYPDVMRLYNRQVQGICELIGNITGEWLRKSNENVKDYMDIYTNLCENHMKKYTVQKQDSFAAALLQAYRFGNNCRTEFAGDYKKTTPQEINNFELFLISHLKVDVDKITAGDAQILVANRLHNFNRTQCDGGYYICIVTLGEDRFKHQDPSEDAFQHLPMQIRMNGVLSKVIYVFICKQAEGSLITLPASRFLDRKRSFFKRGETREYFVAFPPEEPLPSQGPVHKYFVDQLKDINQGLLKYDQES
jgi:hypothetical protein